jgi:serine/threonine protein kinase
MSLLPNQDRMADPDGRLQAALADRYVLQQELGRGGMATVYLATDVKHSRRLAVKILHPRAHCLRRHSAILT